MNHLLREILSKNTILVSFCNIVLSQKCLKNTYKKYVTVTKLYVCIKYFERHYYNILLHILPHNKVLRFTKIVTCYIPFKI